jgi:hypothetical protein
MTKRDKQNNEGNTANILEINITEIKNIMVQSHVTGQSTKAFQECMIKHKIKSNMLVMHRGTF